MYMIPLYSEGSLFLSIWDTCEHPLTCHNKCSTAICQTNPVHIGEKKGNKNNKI